MKPCPICQSDSQHAIWPYLKGIGANNEKLEWRRCNRCAALFSDLTLPGPRQSFPVKGEENGAQQNH
jgi:hypothetical protein